MDPASLSLLEPFAPKAVASYVRPARHDRKLLVWVSLAAVALWMVPFGVWIAIPLTLLNTHIHELFHALAGIGTGGRVEFIRVFSDGSGVTPVYAGSLPILAAAGYVGSGVVGALIIWGASNERGARLALGVLCAVLAMSMLLFVRGDAVGWLSGLVWVVALFVQARYFRGKIAIFTAQFIGVQQCITSLQSLLILLQISAATERQSDAALLGQATGIPAIVWAVAWSLLSMSLMGLALRAAWKGSHRASTVG